MKGVSFLIVLGAVLAAVLAKRKSSPAPKGSRGEQVVHAILRSALPASEYTILRDVTLRADDGAMQIDHLVVSRFGIFVIETKDLAGCIIGAERDGHWIQSLQHLRTEFPNPLWQNRAHIRALQALLGLNASKFHSLVVFTGKAEFRNPMPLNVMQRDRLVAFFQVRTTPSLTPEMTEQAVRTLESSRLEQGAATAARRVEPLRARQNARPGRLASRPRRPRPRQGAGARLAVKGLAGAASLALLVAAGQRLVDHWDGLPGVATVRPAAFPSRGLPLSQSSEPVRAELRCDYSADARQCACNAPDGSAVAVDFEECKARADGALY
jgi:hypothetical protein